MKFLFASDSFKGTLSTEKTAELLTKAAKQVFTQCDCVGLPVADGGEGTVGVFAEVLVPRGIHQVEHATFEGEIQNGTGNRNTALLLDLHPVTDGVTAVCLGAHMARLADDVSVPQELFGDGGLTRVGVADNSESAAFFDFWIHIEVRGLRSVAYGSL